MYWSDSQSCLTFFLPFCLFPNLKHTSAIYIAEMRSCEMHINCCRYAAQPGPSAEPVSIWQQSDPAGMQKAPKNTGYQEGVFCAVGVQPARRMGWIGGTGLGRGKKQSGCIWIPSLHALFVERSCSGWLHGRQAIGLQNTSTCFSEGKLRHQSTKTVWV